MLPQTLKVESTRSRCCMIEMPRWSSPGVFWPILSLLLKTILIPYMLVIQNCNPGIHLGNDAIVNVDTGVGHAANEMHIMSYQQHRQVFLLHHVPHNDSENFDIFGGDTAGGFV